MADDVLITPASRKLEIYDTAGNIDAVIQTDASGNLQITNAGGDIEIGDTSSDVYIGDGTNSVDIIFEQDGEIRGLTGVTLTLGQSDSNVRMATDLNMNSNDITNVNDLTMSGNLTVNGTTITLNTATLNVQDKNITLNYGTGDTSGSANGAGITIQDAVNSSTDATILWDASNDEFDFSHSVKVAGSIGVTNIVTNKVVKFTGSILDDSNITDTGSLITLGSNTTVSGTTTTTQLDLRGEAETSNLNTVDRGLYYWGSTQPATGSPGFNYGMAWTVEDPNQKIQLAFGSSSAGRLAVRRADSGTYYDWTHFYGESTTISGDVSASYNQSTNTLTFTVADDSHNHVISNVDGLQTALDAKLPLAGGTMTGTITSRDVKPAAGYHLQRSDHHSGHLEGSYNNIGANGAKSNPIYTIGSSYNPTDAALSNMYGIGYTSSSATFVSPAGSTNWGMYVAADGDARVWLDGSNGTIWSTGEHYVNSNKVFHDGYHPNADKWTTARTITLGGDLTGNVSIDGSANVTLTAAVVDDSHFHHRLDSTDDRDMKPNTSGIAGSVQALKAFFSSYGGMTGTADTTYVDVLAFDTYSDSSGGGPSAITFKKGNSAGNPEMHIWHAAWNTTTWSDGQRVFADNYHPNADKWTTARTITLGGDLTGNVSIDGSANVTLTAAVTNDSHTHAFNNLTGKTSGTSDYKTTGKFRSSANIVSGEGSGGVSLTINDGYGNANVCWNHQNGVPEQNGQAARIEVNTDGTSTEGTMSFEVSSGDVTANTAVSLPVAMTLAHDYLEIPSVLRHAGDTNTYIQFDADRVRIVNGGGTYLDTNNGSTVLHTSTTFGGDVSGTYNAIVVADDSHNHVISNVDGLQTALDGKLSLSGGTMTGTLTMGANNISMSNSNISGVNAITINDPGEGIVFTGTNNVSLYAVDDANDNIMKFDGAAKLLVGNDRVLASSERDLATNSTGTTSTDFVTVFSVNGNNLASHVRLSVTGTTGNVVVSCVADILCNHSGDIFISSMSGNYTQIDIKVTSNGNEDFAIECLRTDSQTSQATLRYSLVALSQDTTISQPSSHSYTTTTLTHRTKAGSYQSATDGADHGYFNSMRVGNYIYHDGDTDTYIKYDANRIRLYAGGVAKVDTNSTYLTGNQTITLSGDVTGSGTTAITCTVADDSHNHIISNVDGLQTALDAKLPLAGGTMSGTLTVGDGSSTAHQIVVNKADGNSDHIIFKHANTTIGEIGATDTTWLRINQQTNKNIYTPRYIRADNGFYVDNTSTGITGSGNLIGMGTIDSSGNITTSTGNVIATAGNVQANGMFILTGTGTVMRIEESAWTTTTHDMIYAGWTSSTADYVYLKAAGNSTSGHGICLISDNYFYVGDETDETGAITDSAASPISDVWFRTNGTEAHFDGNVIAYSTTISSDIKLKKDIRPIENALDKVLALEGKHFKWKRNDQEAIGFIAQEVEKVIPEIVSETDTLNSPDDPKHKIVDYNAVVPVLVEALKEQQKLINRLEDKIKILENK